MQVYSMEEFMNFKPKRKTLALFGSSAAFSLSPSLHNEIFFKSGIDAEYIAITASPDELPKALELAREKLVGFNCTIPFKQTIIPYLSKMSDQVSVLGAANTIAVVDGEFHGYNTDGIGFSQALKLNSVSLESKHMLLLGCGGAALAVAYEAAKCGAKKITVAARSAEKADDFINRLRAATARDIFAYSPLDTVCGEFDILVNATPVGMGETQDISPVNLDKLSNLSFVYDCIYHPPMPKLLQDADKLGIPWDNGLSMLVLQGAMAHEHWFGSSDYPNEFISDVINHIGVKQAKERLITLWKRSNIALTGFMGCGKTTVGKKLAELMGMDFIDLDQKIEKDMNMSISDIFEKHGESYFRELEARACMDLVKLENTVIATGGGTVIRDQNAGILKENCVIVYLNRSLPQIERNLSGSYSRPMLQVPNVSEHIKSLHEVRAPQYLKNSDVVVYFPEPERNSAQHVLIHI